MVASRQSRVRSLFSDIGLFLLVFLHWILTSVIVDATTNDVETKKRVSVWIFVFSALVNGFSISRSWMFLGSGKGPPETIIGIFFEIVNLVQIWGSAFAMSRYYSRDPEVDIEWFNATLLNSEFVSFVEMSLVSGGVGFTTFLPETMFERLVTWLASYVGGVLCTNIFLLSVVLSRRGFWERSDTEHRRVYESEIPPTASSYSTANTLTFTLPNRF